ncbi:WcbI family polysaccharide biosynthesis putative acetyltransferase [Corynebacterium aquatimens]|uniref:Polysaccharide biosynthesis enzyme WcbI domain-containing protein n=1 Tax=Corynebacterium aquatimens TaxID=1190508 RepID=A0A931DY05_9CORY|nr:WcbI family polysaccharide biosynthesis putative acetyltransferase [Corynebacterium aquatimens]MBG6122195.1 hypothetical protein [Corynebacterium aquatimens]WJY65264.1 hypothetical protein CAQUA_02725 [Corynebacterium aquatimens]
MPFLTVVGNCQAESLRRLVTSTGIADSERIPPVHEMEASDMEWFCAMLARTDILITQPIRNDYRGLPLGTEQTMACLPRSARTVLFPVMRFDALTPTQAIIRDPEEPSLDPPVVPYHDLRILAAHLKGRQEAIAPTPADDAYRAKLAETVEQMRRREEAAGDAMVGMSDFLETVPVWHTINHPDNATMGELARRVATRLGAEGEVVLPDYEMLGELDSPIDASAAAALGASDRVPAHRGVWSRRREGEIPFSDITAAQLEFYRERPGVVQAGLARYGERMRQFGLID